LAPTRRPPRDDDDTSPDVASVPGGGRVASTDHLYSIYQRLTTIESEQSYMRAAVDDSKTKIDAFSREFTGAKAKFDLLLPITKAIASSLKGILAAICVFGLSVLGMWLKHHYGW
jgi:hypothetical protein